MIKTKNGLPKHCYRVKDRHGKDRVRFLKGRVTAYIPGRPWSDDFMRQHAKLLDGVTPPSALGAERTRPGTINALAVAYYKSLDFKNLATSTQNHRRRIIERFRAEYGTEPLRLLRRKHVQLIHGAMAETPEAANNLVKILRVMLNYAVDLDMIDGNPATGVRKYKNRGDGFHTWTDDEIAKFEAAHPIGSRARLALALLLYTAQRVSDVAKMGWQHVTGDAIKVTQQKTGTQLTIPLHPDLKAMLTAVPRTNLSFMLTDRGAPFTAQGLGDFFKRACKIAGLRLWLALQPAFANRAAAALRRP